MSSPRAGPAIHERPLRVAAGLYDEAARALYENARRAVPNVSLYRYGSVLAPGISDLDLIAVFPEGATVRMSALSPSALAPELRYVLWHRPLMLSRSQFESVPLAYPSIAPSHVGGPELSIRHLDGEERKLLGLMMGIEFLPVRWGELMGISAGGSLAVRSALLVLASLKHTVAHLAEWNVESARWSEFVARVDSLRARWFECEDVKEVTAALREGERVIRELIVAHQELLTDVLGQRQGSVSHPTTVITHTETRVTICTPAIEAEDFPAEAITTLWRRATCATRFAWPAMGVGHPGTRRHLEIVLSGDPPYAAELTSRIDPPPRIRGQTEAPATYVRLAYERAMLGWRRSTLRSEPREGIHTVGFPGPLFSNVHEPISYRGTTRERAAALLRRALTRIKGRLVARALSEIRRIYTL